MSPNLEMSAEVFDRLLDETVGRVDLSDDKLMDKNGTMATANSCYRSCAHTVCFCIS